MRTPSTFCRNLRAIRSDAERAGRAISEIRQKLESIPADIIDMGELETELRQHHPEFTRTLRTRYPELTAMEVRVCSMLRMRMATAELARWLCLSPSELQTHRRNIRRKLGLGHREDLQALLDTL